MYQVRLDEESLLPSSSRRTTLPTSQTSTYASAYTTIPGSTCHNPSNHKPYMNEEKVSQMVNTAIRGTQLDPVQTTLGFPIFHIGKRIGEGGFGKVFEGFNTYTGEAVAIKISKECSKNKSQLENERDVLCTLNDHGFPKCIYFGFEWNSYILVMDRLGASLSQLLQYCKGSFTLKTTLMLADQCLTLIEKLHRAGFVHGDIKPTNFVMGLGEMRCNQVFLIDFGITKRYLGQEPNRSGLGFIGSPAYCSLNIHEGFNTSLRDDLESFGYTLAKFLQGRLPWNRDVLDQLAGDTVSEKIYRLKRHTSVKSLYKGFPDCFVQYMNYCRSLSYQDTPDYGYLRSLFQAEMNRLKFAYDCQFDWILYNHIPD